jgi:3-phosphoshikimate 1-carboxyvinyltransferase
MIVSVGGKSRIEGDSLIVNGGAPLSGGKVRTFGDHRIAMAAAVLACGATAPVVLDDAGVVAKSYPGFWNDFDNLNIIR